MALGSLPTLASMFGPTGTGLPPSQPVPASTSLLNTRGPITAEQLVNAMMGLPGVADQPTPYSPTAGLPDVSSGTMSIPELQQWQAYFSSPGAQYGSLGPGGGGAPQPQQFTNQLVQTGSQWQSTMPSLWNTSFAQPSNLAALGIATGPNQQATAANINASPYAGQNPSNPYYNLFLNQLGQGDVTPTYAMQQVPVPQQPQPQASPFAQIVGGQLIGNLTPEEQRLATAYGIPGQYLPDWVNLASQAQAQNPQAPNVQSGAANQLALQMGFAQPFPYMNVGHERG